ncbi:MAG: hypothetical protein ACLP4V_34690 [Methylocella sp.]
MDKIRISVVSGAALLALTATASAGPMTVPSAQVISPPISLLLIGAPYRRLQAEHDPASRASDHALQVEPAAGA